jgi:hypothetical protein
MLVKTEDLDDYGPQPKRRRCCIGHHAHCAWYPIFSTSNRKQNQHGPSNHTMPLTVPNSKPAQMPVLSSFSAINQQRTPMFLHPILIPHRQQKIVSSISTAPSCRPSCLQLLTPNWVHFSTMGKMLPCSITTLEDMGHPQPATTPRIQTDNACDSSIANGSIKQCSSKAIGMQFYWIKDCVAQGQFIVNLHRGTDNLAD